ncbi:transposase [Chryseobacterium shigense]|uniref:Helix-turn-helix domain-containing protein n=1 Tax=Chryseobacterium shigense TaxID=297244 RepID=A0A1N7IEE4_9FLAO|nr:transposase [Chryseobacterium shigense]PQA91468.1 transposase [Chryseobacterium shigense]SIS35445.1 hypothetical protein SAMN05421639_103293 [Chryseobacterium shigense]
MGKSGPNYKKIYTEIIVKKYPEKYESCYPILQKEVLSVLDVIKLNQLIFAFEDLETSIFNQKHKAYDKATILNILEYQKRNGYTNMRIADEFKLSRNSIAKWKKIFMK